MRRQLNLFDGQIHLRNPLFQHVKRGLMIAKQQPVEPIVYRDRSFWPKEFFASLCHSLACA
jgi:hypothetical protein